MDYREQYQRYVAMVEETIEQELTPLEKQVMDLHLTDHDGRLHLGHTCEVAGLGPRHERNGSVEYYLSEPVVEDDPKAQGVMMMAYGEYLLLHNNEE